MRFVNVCKEKGLISSCFKVRLFFELTYFEFCIWIEDHLRQMCNGTSVHHCLSQLWCVFGDVTEGGGCDAFDGHLRFEKTQHQQGDSARIHNGL